MKVPEWKPHPKVKLCCQVKPLYKCGRCGYQRCSDHSPSHSNVPTGGLQDKEEYLHPFYTCLAVKWIEGMAQGVCNHVYCGRCVTWWAALETGEDLHHIHTKYES